MLLVTLSSFASILELTSYHLRIDHVLDHNSLTVHIIGLVIGFATHGVSDPDYIHGFLVEFLVLGSFNVVVLAQEAHVDFALLQEVTIP